jgi:hypothetical protein
MRLITKGLKFIGLGIVIWGLGLLWPDEVNQVLTLLVMIRLILGLGVIGLVVYAFDQHLRQYRDHQRDGAGQDHPSRPIPPTPAPLAQ